MIKSWISLVLAALLLVFPLQGLAASTDTTELLTTQNADGTLCVIGLADPGRSGRLEIPARIDGREVTRISERAFAGSDLTEVEIPASVTEIGSEAFQDASSLEHVALPQSVAQIGTYTFADTALETCILPSHISQIPEGLFSGCGSLTAVTIPADVTLVQTNAFSGCEALTTVYFCGTGEQYSQIRVMPEGNESFLALPARISSQEPSGFLYNVVGESTGDNLTVEIVGMADRQYTGPVVVPDTLDGYPVAGIGPHAFEFMDGITSVDLPENVQYISRNAFCQCAGLESAAFTAGLETIGDSAFRGCSSLTSIDLPAGLHSIGDEAFSTCTSLASAILPSSIVSPGKYLFAFSGLLSADIPLTWQTIPEGMFQGCRQLAEVTIPGSLFAVNANAFSECTALETVYVVGTESQFDSIIVHDGNAPFKNAAAIINAVSLSLEELSGTPKSVIAGLTVTAQGTDSVLVLPALHSITTQDAQIYTAGIDGQPLEDTAPVGTGMTARWEDPDGNAQSAEFLVMGDVTGSGVFNIVQLVTLANAVIGVAPLEGVYAAAGDWTGNGRLDIADLTREAQMFQAS